jgi:DNA mismatch repair protein MutH
MQNFIPQNLPDLQTRCNELNGQTLATIAQRLNLNIPANLLHAKGWVGQLLESFLGTSASSKAMPDFPELGLELKTIPVDKNLKPLETTYVCTVQTNQYATQWRESWVYNKLKHVLWIPIISSPDLAIPERIIGTPIFWHMDAATEEILRTDWEELMEMLQLGFAKNLSAKYGTYLHIRPKAASSSVLQDYVDEVGNNTKIVPKGFYLRTAFTAMVLQQLR